MRMLRMEQQWLKDKTDELKFSMASNRKRIAESLAA
jgi:hypothetical protein